MAPLGLLVCALALSGYLLQADFRAHAATRIETRALGQSLDLDRDELVTAKSLARAFLRERVRLHAGSEVYEVARAALGAQVNVAALAAQLRAARDASSPLRRLHAQHSPGQPLLLPITAELGDARARLYLHGIASRFDRPPRPLRVDFASGASVAAEPGHALSIERTLDVLAEALFTGERELHAVVDELPANGAAPSTQRLDVTRELGRGERTPARDRAYNLARVVSSLHGLVILPGEQLDLKQTLALWLRTDRLRRSAFSVEHGDGRLAFLDDLEHAIADAARALPGAQEHAPAVLYNETPLPLALGLAFQGGVLRASVYGPDAQLEAQTAEEPRDEDGLGADDASE